MSAPPACVQGDAPLAPRTSWLIGGPADFLALPKTIDEARECAEWARAEGLPVTVLGGGTNVLISDRGVEGLTLCLAKLSGVESAEATDGAFRVTCLAGTSKSELLKIYLKRKLAPALFLAGLPGDVGGGVAMNAGVGEAMRPREFVEIVEWIEVLRLDDARAPLARFAAADLAWSYRRSDGWQPGAIVRAGLVWPDEPQADVLERVRDANRVRLAKQPLDQPSCGSVFVNPPGHKSGQLIERCGLKGLAVGGARVSEKHANFIVNSGGATAADVRAVIERVQSEVRAREGVDLRTEVVSLGR